MEYFILEVFWKQTRPSTLLTPENDMAEKMSFASFKLGAVFFLMEIVSLDFRTQLKNLES